jgi:curved DNA-binding protein CbpA
MQNHYETLGVPENASPAWIQRQYQKLVDEAQQNTSLADAERIATIAKLTTARDVLADAAKRDEYDQQLQAAHAKASGGGALKRAIVPLVLLGIVGLAGAAYWQQMEQKRIYQEQEARERALEAQRAEMRAAEAKRRQEMLLAEAETRRAEEEERLRIAREQREQELKTEQYVAGKAFVPTVKTAADLREERQKRYQDYQQRVLSEWEERLRRAESEREAAAARAELNRQKNFLEQQRYEEDMAARQRAEAARRAERATQPPR